MRRRRPRLRFEVSALKDFRNLNGRFEWGPGVNLILGPNGAGKTNLLESLGILAGWGPFSGHARLSVAWGAQRAFLKARVSGEAEREIRAQLSSRMTLQEDGRRTSCTEARLTVPALVFLPGDIGLADGPPAVRRLFLDRLCALCHPPYARRLAEFRQVARSRAALLRQGRPAGGTALPFARLGGWVMEARRRAADRLRELTDAPFSFRVLPELDRGGAEYLLAALEETAERERHALRPLVGPGRDDLVLTAGGRPAAEALSRGQKRRMVLALILAAGRLVQAQLRRAPVLLFDDLGAELDAAGRAAAGEALFSTGWQAFVTGAEDPFAGCGFERRALWLGKPA